MIIKNVEYDQIEEELDRLEDPFIEGDDYEDQAVMAANEKALGDDVIIVQAPAYRVVDKGLIFATGVYCNYLPAIDAYDTGEFSVTCIYEDVPDDKFNPARWVYFEQGPPLAAIYHYTGIREGK